MAVNMDEMTERARAGWHSFSWLLGLSTAGIVIALLLMAAFLL
jgi:hypothetical protein